MRAILFRDGFGIASDPAPAHTDRMRIIAAILLGSTLAASGLTTWTHETPAWNDQTPVAPDHVRASTHYRVRVMPGQPDAPAHDSFVYMTIPRNGSAPTYARTDGAEFAATAGITMSWSTFLYREDVWVEVERISGGDTRAFIIRPTNLRFETHVIDETRIRIRVPYDDRGFRFSIEFDDDLFTSYNDLSGISGRLTESPVGPAIHTEPRHALLIFAEPEHRFVAPTADDGLIHHPEPGRVDNLNEVDADIIYFRPGVYWMPRETHAYLRERVRWVHLAPGAYVKGAIEFRGASDDYRITGAGVLSGELYPYEPDRRNNYASRDESTSDGCQGTCIKMLQGYSTVQPQRMTISGITVANPPYHAFVVYGDEASFTTEISGYKQVGAWYWQTDGLEIYRGGSLRDSFLHANDDVIKLYHSDVTVENIVVWKGENGPVFQWGWKPRTIERVLVNGVDIIHQRMYWKDAKFNTGILNAARYTESDAADRGARIKNMRFLNIRAEGMNSCLMRVYALSNHEDIMMRNVWIESWNGMSLDAQQSILTTQHPDIEVNNVQLINYRVGSEAITRDRDNWQHDQPGRLNIDASLWGRWDVR